MRTAILVLALHSVISIAPIRDFHPFPAVRCPRGYSLWWPDGKEFDNDRYAECVKPVPQQRTEQHKPLKTIKNVSLRQK